VSAVGKLIVFVIPCTGAKLHYAAPVREMYQGVTFRQALPVIEREAELTAALGPDTCVRVLSAKHGLLALDEVIQPYDQRIDDLGETALALLEVLLRGQLTELDAGRGDIEIAAFLPRAYLEVLSGAAVRVGGHVTVTNVYEGCRGIGDQKAVIASVRATQPSPAQRAAAAAVRKPLRLLHISTLGGRPATLVESPVRDPRSFWNDWNSWIRADYWCRTEVDPKGRPYTVKWGYDSYRNSRDEHVTSLSVLLANGVHPSSGAGGDPVRPDSRIATERQR
jgi:hypothetical protein